MSKINQIQQALLRLSGGEFQKLSDAYLFSKGFDRINSIGSFPGTNKVRKGTPDSFVEQSSGGYLFAEHTTQQSGLFKKLMSDLEKCLTIKNSKTTEIAVSQIIFCFTGALNVDEVNDIKETCKDNDITIELFGIDTISFDLYLKYPGLARDFLGILVDTGQIVTPDEFIKIYNKNKLSTKIDVNLIGREKEKRDIIKQLDYTDIAILSGKTGVGKTRLALEICDEFQKQNPDFNTLCIFRRDRDLWEDLKVRFSAPGNYLVLVDDANRISRFEYVIDLVINQREDQKIKVISTVRDYALSSISESLKIIGNHYLLELDRLSDEIIEEIAANEFNINNPIFTTRILDIARGNPRLAVMCCMVINEKKTLESVYNVSDLFDQYFSTIHEDLRQSSSNIDSNDLLKSAAIVSFMKSVDKNDHITMETISKAFDIPTDLFWRSALHLHDLEILDMYENEIIRTADQVLATYLFYVATFKERTISFRNLLNYFFPKNINRLTDSLNPVLNSFDEKYIVSLIRPHIEELLTNFKARESRSDIYQLMETFWFAIQTDTLLLIKIEIESLSYESLSISDISFEKSTNLREP